MQIYIGTVDNDLIVCSLCRMSECRYIICIRVADLFMYEDEYE